MQLKQKLAEIKSKEATVNKLKAQISVLENDRRAAILQKTNLEQTIKNISGQLSLAEASAGILHSDDENIHTVTKINKRLENFNEVLFRFRFKMKVRKNNSVPADAAILRTVLLMITVGKLSGCLNECDLIASTRLFNMAGIRTQYGLMHMSINDMKTGLSDEQTERLRAWQQRQKITGTAMLFPQSFLTCYPMENI